MTTSLQVRTAWSTKLLNHSAVEAFTTRAYTYDVSLDNEFDVSKLYHAPLSGAPTVNFVLCLVTRQQEPLVIQNTRYTFQVRLEYYLQQEDIGSSTYNTLIDRLETMDDLVRTQLGGTWDGTVDFYSGGTPSDITVVQIDKRSCWRGAYLYSGIKTV
jgi:hypothetical protein